MKIHTVICSKDNTKIELTAIQFNDFEMGIMGNLHCPSCNSILLPSHSALKSTIEISEVEGEDPGWL